MIDGSGTATSDGPSSCNAKRRRSRRELEAVPGVQLPEQSRDVALDRSFGDAEPRRDLAVREPFAERGQHFGFSASHAGSTPNTVGHAASLALGSSGIRGEYG